MFETYIKIEDQKNLCSASVRCDYSHQHLVYISFKVVTCPLGTLSGKNPPPTVVGERERGPYLPVKYVLDMRRHGARVQMGPLLAYRHFTLSRT